MVFVNKMGWLSELGDSIKRSIASPDSSRHPTPIGILAFETAKTMSRLLSLYKSLQENEITKLKNQTVKSGGVSYLNSSDEGYLLNLACAEMMEDLDRSAATVARLGKKCSNFGLNQFDIVYDDLKLGSVDFGKLEYGSRETEKIVDKMEKLVAATASLYSSLEALSEMEVSERKLNIIKKQNGRANYEHFEQKIAYQRKMVRHYRETSLWGQTFDRSVGFLARLICIIYARIYDVFGPLSHDVTISGNMRNSRSGPIPSTSSSGVNHLIRFHSQNSSLSLRSEETDRRVVFHAAGPATVGGCGLALRYANVILLAERYLDLAVTIGEDARVNLYQMLPENLKFLVRTKLSKTATRAEDDDVLLSAGWKEALTEMLKWLVPVARDTVTWQEKKNFYKMKFDSKPQPSVLLMHTLHFSDKEKAEAAIAEVLVGLSCVYKYEKRRNCGKDGGGCGNEERLLGGGRRFSFGGVC